MHPKQKEYVDHQIGDPCGIWRALDPELTETHRARGSGGPRSTSNPQHRSSKRRVSK